MGNNRKVIIAEYKCLKCEYKYYGKGPTQCPKCYNLYVKWINYEELAKNVFWVERKWYKKENVVNEIF